MPSKKPFRIEPFEAPYDDVCDVLLIAGEHSGDEQAARMLELALEKNPDLRVCALGGNALRSAGAQILFELPKFSVVGLVEVLKNYSKFKAIFSALLEWVKKHKPKTICFVDYPGFNLRFASALKKEGLSLKGGGKIKLLYYISPQIWAWKAKRRFKMADTLDELAVIFNFESECYKDTNLNTVFVGHPFVAQNFESRIFYDKTAPLLFLPGSRKIAVSKIFPIMLDTLRLLENAKVNVPYPSKQILETLNSILKKYPDLSERVSLCKISSDDKIGASAVLMSSGTISLSACLEGIPGAIVYKANPLTYLIGRALVSVKYLGIANIILDRPAWPEFIQNVAKPNVIANRLRACMKDEKIITQAKTNAQELKKLLKAENKITAGEWLAEQVS